ncbi:Uncharacterised protein [Serratia fonticola]|uniref:Uncharacterized protein n=1 Tax=Serratia fonticola TaxID=47917 RepID=A0A4U9TNI3_SERFO|nr:Uncharacterised protein [Serratia fonticola]
MRYHRSSPTESRSVIWNFSPKGEAERQLNQGLHQRGINRTILDSRPLHHAKPHSPAIRDAQQKKAQTAGACSGNG